LTVLGNQADLIWFLKILESCKSDKDVCILIWAVGIIFHSESTVSLTDWTEWFPSTSVQRVLTFGGDTVANNCMSLIVWWKVPSLVLMFMGFSFFQFFFTILFSLVSFMFGLILFFKRKVPSLVLIFTGFSFFQFFVTILFSLVSFVHGLILFFKSKVYGVVQVLMEMLSVILIFILEI
jgi:hypothetical protein